MNEISGGVTEADEALKLRDISDSDVARLAQEIERAGVAVIPSYIDDTTLARLRQVVVGIVDGNGGEYTVLTGKVELANTLRDRIGVAPELLSLMHRIYENGCGRAAPVQSLYQVLRCLSGTSGLRQAYFFHYDSYVVTALLPIIIPQEGVTGDLVMKPNHRRVRGSYLANLIDKMLVDNQLAQKYFRRQADSHQGSFTKVQIVPGNLYLFWGYRSLHANEPCDPRMIRATALFHFGDPHADSRLRKLTGRAKVRATAAPAAAPA
jgi:hypothetical protein